MRYGSWRWVVALAGVVCVLTSGCGGEAPEPAADLNENPVAAVENTASVEGPRAIRGLCVVGNEVRTFIPCGSKKVYWIEADRASFAAFEVAVERYTDEPYEPFFAEIDGRLSDETGDGFAADYDGRFFVERLIRLAPASELDCGE